MLSISANYIMKTAFSRLVAHIKVVEPVLKNLGYGMPVPKSTVSCVKWAIIGVSSYFSEK